MFKKTDHKCKCSHLRSEHNKTFTSYCKICPCTDYLKFDMPNVWEKIATIFVGLFIGCVTLVFTLSLLLIYRLSQIPELVDTEMKITFGEFFGLAAAIIIFIGLFLYPWFLDMFLDYWREKKRRSF